MRSYWIPQIDLNAPIAIVRRKARDAHQQGCGIVYSPDDLLGFPEAKDFELKQSAFKEFLMEYWKTGLNY